MKRIYLFFLCSFFIHSNFPITVFAPSLRGINGAFTRPDNVARRGTSFPYLSGDLFRFQIADFQCDELRTSFDTQDVKEGDIIFVLYELFPYFFKEVHPHIKNRYILLTHNSDYSIPGPYRKYLDDEKIIAWFGTNVAIKHPKLHVIPFGIANRYWRHGNFQLLEEIMAENHPEKISRVYCNFSTRTNRKARGRAAHYFKGQSFAVFARKKPWQDYLRDIAQSTFVASPPGNGVDCHRTYEALYMGSYPIVLSSGLDPIFEDLPVVIVKNWEEVTPQLLEEKILEFQGRNFNFDKLYANYWINQIISIKNKFQKNTS